MSHDNDKWILIPREGQHRKQKDKTKSERWFYKIWQAHYITRETRIFVECGPFEYRAQAIAAMKEDVKNLLAENKNFIKDTKNRLVITEKSKTRRRERHESKKRTRKTQTRNIPSDGGGLGSK